MRKFNLLLLSAVLSATVQTGYATDLGMATSVYPVSATTNNETLNNWTMNGGYTNMSTRPLMILTWGEEVHFCDIDELPKRDGELVSKGNGYVTIMSLTNPDLDATKKTININIGADYYTSGSEGEVPTSSQYVCVALNDYATTKFQNGVTYYFTLPAGLLINDEGVGNPEQTFTYTKVALETGLSNNPEWFTPTPTLVNTKITGGDFAIGELDKLTISPAGVTLLEAPCVGQLPVYNSSTQELRYIENGIGIENGKIVADLSSISDIPGMWEVFVPGSIGYIEKNGKISSYGGTIAKFRILKNDGATEFLPDNVSLYGSYIGEPLPAYNSTLPTVIVSWEGLPFNIAENANVTFNSEGSSISTTLERISRTVNGFAEFSLKITPTNPGSGGPSTYNLVIPAGTVISGDAINREMSIKIVYTPYTSDYVVTPAKSSTVPLEQFTGVTVEFPGAKTIIENPSTTAPCILKEGSLEKELVMGETILIEGNKLIIPMKLTVRTTRSFTLIIPRNKFVIDNSYLNTAISHSFRVSPPTPVAVNLKVTGADGLENAEDYVEVELVTDPEEGITEPVELENGEFKLSYTQPTGFKLTPNEGYEVEVSVNKPALAAESILEMDTFTLIDLPYDSKFNNTVFTAEVSHPSAPTTKVTLNYTAGDGIEGKVWDYVTVSVNEFNDGGGTEGEEGVDTDVKVITPNANPFAFKVIPSTTLSFTPVKGYSVEVASEQSEEGVLEIREGEVTSATIFKGAPKALSFMLTVNLKSDNSVSSLFDDGTEETIYNLQGIRVDRNHLSKGDVYIIGGKKVIFK